MKTAKKVLIYCLVLVLVVGGSILGTLAFLTDRASVENTFTVGNVDITVDEAIVNPDGTLADPAGRTEEGNQYHMIPGQTYVKDPTLTVKAGSEESYVRMLVTITCYDELQKIFEGKFLPQYFVEGWDPAVWVSTTVVDVSDDGKSATYEFRYRDKVDASDATEDVELKPLFTKFKVPGEFTNEVLEAIKDIKITAEGHAIQAATFENEVNDEGEIVKFAVDFAWEAFDAQYAD